MRALRILGLADGVPGASRNLVLEDAVTGEQFSARCDDRLLAAVRGDSAGPGQPEMDAHSQLRPKEIQARIRAGATVEQLAALAGTNASRVERFAYPVLLERASMAERAMKARPTIDGITAGSSVADTVAAILASRGHDGDTVWDAYRDDDGWVLALTWSAGRSENRATWLFHPGPAGGTLSARDDAAAEIVDPALRVLRPLRPVHPDAASTKLLDPTVPTTALSRPSEAASRSVHPAGGKLRGPVAGAAAAAGAMVAQSASAVEPLPSSPASGSTRFGRQPLPTSLAAGGVGAAGVGAAGVGAAGVGAAGGAHVVVSTAEGNSAVVTAPELLVRAESIQPASPPAATDRLTQDLLGDERAGVTGTVARAESVNTGTDPVARASFPGLAATSPSVTGPSVTSTAPVGVRGESSSTARPAGGPLGSAAAHIRPGSPGAVHPGVVPPRPMPARGSGKRGNRPVMPSWEDVLLGARSDRATGR